MTVEFKGHVIEVVEGYEELALAVLRCGIHVGSIGLEPEPEEFYITFSDTSDCEQFADLIVACAEKDLLARLFGKNGCLEGSFSIETSPETDKDDYRILTVMEMCLPVACRDELPKLFQNTSKLVDADVSYCDSNARRSSGTIGPETIPKSEWDGHIFSYVPGVDSLSAGEHVKLTFHASKPAHIMERLWVKVTVVDDDDVTGTVDNHPASLTNLHQGDTVHFKKWQIMRVAPARKQAEVRNMTLN